MEVKKLYRYERICYDEYYNLETINILLKEFKVIKETEHTYLISLNGYSKTKRVFKNSRNSYAYDTTERAQENFVKRTTKAIAINKTMVKLGELFLTKAKEKFNL